MSKISRHDNVTRLPDHKFIAKLLTAISLNMQQKASVCSHHLCKKEPSITICMECKMLFCHECYMVHEGFPPLQSHATLSISEIVNHQKQREIGAVRLSCTQHKDAIARFYCETCKDLICIKCMASVHTKPGHACIAIYEIFRKQQDAVRLKCATINAMKLEGTRVGTQFCVCTIAHSQTVYSQ